MIAIFAKSGMAGISKPELFYWKLCLVSEEAAVFTQYFVILITVTAITGVCTWVGHPARALTTTRWCSAPVRHLQRITWHPPTFSAFEQLWMITLVLYKLLTAWGDSGEASQLRKTNSRVVNVPWVAAWSFISMHICPVLTVVTDDCHANSILVSHVTVHWKWHQISLAIWINVVVSTCRCRVSLL